MIDIVIFYNRLRIKVRVLNENTISDIESIVSKYCEYKIDEVLKFIIVYGDPPELYRILMELTYEYDLLVN